MAKIMIRHEKISTNEVIEILSNDGCIYWTEEGYRNACLVDWLLVSVFFNTNEIHTFCNGYVTRIYL